MIEEKAARIHREILRLLKVVIERDFQPCGLEEPLKTTLYDLALKLAEENLRGLNIILGGVFKAVEQARFLAEKHNKDLCHYLEMALKRGWIENWVLGLMGALS